MVALICACDQTFGKDIKPKQLLTLGVPQQTFAQLAFGIAVCCDGHAASIWS
jgi:hypothetical protein